MRKAVQLLFVTCIVISFSVSSRMQASDLGAQLFAERAEQLDPYKAYHALDGRFMAGDDGVVTDIQTGLEWFAGPDRDGYTHSPNGACLRPRGSGQDRVRRNPWVWSR